MASDSRSSVPSPEPSSADGGSPRTSSDASDVRWTTYERALLPAYLRFAIEAFGRHEYQANPQYPQWLYEECADSRAGARDFLVGLDPTENVIACAHKMRLPWRLGDTMVDVPALHNLAVSTRHRHGLGAMLILAAMARDAHVLVPGSVEPVSTAYRRLGCQPIASRWLRIVLGPALPLHMLRARAGLAPRPWSSSAARARCVLGLAMDPAPSPSRLGEIAARLAAGDAAAGPAWTADLLAWRFFHPLGPRTLLVESRDGRFGGLIGLGHVRGVRVARVVELWAAGVADLARGMRSLRVALALAGGDVLLAFTADPSMIAMLDAACVRGMRGATPDTWVYHRRRGHGFAATRFQGGAGDFGFEAI